MNTSDRELANRVDQEHKDLRATVDRLLALFKQTVEPEQFVGYKLDLLWQLRDFQNQLQKHFDLEEDGGYNADLIRVAPHLAPRIADLENDHRKIESDLARILGILKKVDSESSPSLETVKAQTNELLNFIITHESEENAIIQEAYYQDYGVGD